MEFEEMPATIRDLQAKLEISEDRRRWKITENYNPPEDFDIMKYFVTEGLRKQSPWVILRNQIVRSLKIEFQAFNDPTDMTIKLQVKRHGQVLWSKVYDRFVIEELPISGYLQEEVLEAANHIKDRLLGVVDWNDYLWPEEPEDPLTPFIMGLMTINELRIREGLEGINDDAAGTRGAPGEREEPT